LRLDVIQHAYFIDDTVLIFLWFGILFVRAGKSLTENQSNLLYRVVRRLQYLLFDACHNLKLVISKISLDCTCVLFVQFVDSVYLLVLFLGKFFHENRKCVLKLKCLIDDIFSLITESNLEIFKPIWDAVLVVFTEDFVHFFG
jgi:hypothetical protein